MDNFEKGALSTSKVKRMVKDSLDNGELPGISFIRYAGTDSKNHPLYELSFNDGEEQWVKTTSSPGTPNKAEIGLRNLKINLIVC